MTMRTARLPGDALVDGMGFTVSPGCNAGLDDDDQGIAGRLVTARIGNLLVEGAGVALGTALPQPCSRRAWRHDVLQEAVERRTGWRRGFERYATRAMAAARQVTFKEE